MRSRFHVAALTAALLTAVTVFAQTPPAEEQIGRAHV